MFVMGCYGHKLSNGVLFAHHLILGVLGGSSHLGYRRRVRLSHNPRTRVKWPFFDYSIAFLDLKSNLKLTGILNSNLQIYVFYDTALRNYAVPILLAKTDAGCQQGDFTYPPWDM